MTVSLRAWLPLALVALLALGLRTWDLAARPMHADEANQAVKLGELLEYGRYAFDPADHHGPTLYYAALPLAWLRGQRTLAALDETTLRLVPALFGTLAVLLIYLLAAPAPSSALNSPPPSSVLRPPLSVLRPPLSVLRSPALLAAAFLAVSPPAVYYSRDFIQETLLLTLVLATLVCAQRWWLAPRLRWALLTGVSAGLAQATKASAPLFLFAALLAALPLRRSPSLNPQLSTLNFVRAFLAALLAALATAAAFYSSFGTHFAGLRDAFATYTTAAHRTLEAGAHTKSTWYYFRLFGWQTDGGLTFTQLPFAALALCGLGLAFIARDRLLRWAAVYTTVIAVGLALIPYKTPWHTIHLVPGLALLAAGALARFPRRSVASLLFAVVVVSQLSQTRLTSFQRPADSRNPYAYVHSSPDVKKFRPLADAALAARPAGVVRVIAAEYWPLPWYFRGLDRVGYWSTPPDDCDAALVITSADFADTVRARLHGAYRESILGLRPGRLCVVFTPVP